MRQVVRGAAWVVIALSLLLVAVYVGLLVGRRLNPPVVAVDSSNGLAGWYTGDAALLRDVPIASLAEDDVVAARLPGGRVVVGRLVAIDQEGSRSTLVLAGTGRGDAEVRAPGDGYLGHVDRRVPLAGWVLLVLRPLAVKVVLGLAVAGFVLALVLTGRSPLDELLAEPEPLALGAGPVTPGGAVAYVDAPMSITPEDLRQVRFAQTRKGYDTEAVDRALDTVADSLEQLLAERGQLIERLRTLEAEVERYKGMEAQLGQTLAMAEKSAEQVKAEAQAEAQRILAEAKAAAPQAAAAAAPPPEGAMVELLGETRAIRSLLQAVLVQNGQLQPPPPPYGQQQY